MSVNTPELPELLVRPIGFIRTGMRTKFDSPHQPKDGVEQRNVIELLPGMDLQTATRDLAGFSRIWLVWWFHRNSTWKPLVLPPRGGAQRRGVFATRSPHRPNPIGITSVPLIEVNKLQIVVGNTDLIDGTPILDIKPYIPSVDAFPSASQGWLNDVERLLDLPPNYSIAYTPHASAQIDWLREQWGIDFTARASEILSRDPSVHRTRRVRKHHSGLSVLGCGAWRLFFSVTDAVVTVSHIAPGYPDRLLLAGADASVPDQGAQIAFQERWRSEQPSSPGTPKRR
jgi:tRNA-Thr(GGU) m(6)t(6)A37 methyltransferase TsaA